MDWLLKLGLVFDRKTWKTVGNEMYGQKSMKILKILNYSIWGGASVHFFVKLIWTQQIIWTLFELLNINYTYIFYPGTKEQWYSFFV